MFSIVLALLALHCIVAEELCDTGKTYARFYMVCKSYCTEQSFTISSGETVVYTSGPFVNNEISDTNDCLTSSSNDQYTLKLSDSFGDSWASGSYLAIYGEYGNIFFKGYLLSDSNDELTLSMHYPIKRYQAWKLSNQYSADWMQTDFQDSAWSEETMGSVTGSYSGTQYFRKAFTGVSGMSAYEVRLNYRYGVVVYVNGVEAFRDNMPKGTIDQSTAASGSYPEASMRGFIRMGSEIATSGVLAVEIHATTGTTLTTVDFDAYMAALASGIPEMNCVIYPYSVTYTSSISCSNLENIFDMNKGTSATFSGDIANIKVSYMMDPLSAPYINGMRYYINSESNNIAVANVYGSVDSSVYNPLLTIRNGESSAYNNFYSYWSADLYRYYRFNVVSSTDSTLLVFELMPMTCLISETPTSFSYEKESYSYYVDLEEVHITPTSIEVSNCTLSNSQLLPDGLTFDADSCTVSGYARAPLAQTTFTVTSASLSMSSTFTLTINACEGMVVTILRTYKYMSSNEGFSVIDPETETVLYSVAISSGQPTATDVRENLCITIPRIGIDVFSSLASWDSGSYLYVNTLLGSNEWDTLLRARYNNYLGLETSYFVSINYPIHPSDNWFYKTGEVPENWYSADTSGWTEASSGSFPASTNRVQLYKKTFSIDSLDNIAGFVVSVRYKYGIAIYLNNIPIFMNGITEVSTTAAISNIYPSLIFRQMSFPVKLMTYETMDEETYEEASATTYLQTGSNTIAIALIANSDESTNSTFNAALSLMGNNEYSRVFEYTYQASGAIQQMHGPFTFHHSDFIACTVCVSNSVSITFNNDRREWISSILIQVSYSEEGKQPRQLKVYGKNSVDTDWTKLGEYTGLGWSLLGQTKKIWLKNNSPYNQYKFEDIGTGNESSCIWKINRIDMFSDNTNREVPNLEYGTVVVIKDVEMAEVYPSSDLYRDFTVSPELPEGVKICSQSGVIYGTATVNAPAKDYTISAKKATTGESVSTTINFDVSPCSGKRSMMTSKMRIDNYASECSYKLFKGRGDGGELLASISRAPNSNSLLYLDRCLDNGIYTFYAFDKNGDGWFIPGGYMMTVDVGATIFDTKPVGESETKPSFSSTTFSSYLPFQITVTEWKVLKAETVDSSWTTASFDDSTWQSMLPSAIGTSDFVTTYLRKTFDLPNLDDYQVLNVRILYNGGIAAYFNGVRVARFNLEKDFTASTPAIAEHDSTVYSGFHIILPMQGAVVGTNVLAIEIHNPANVATDIVFDATGIFGVEECSMVLDTYSSVTGTDCEAESQESETPLPLSSLLDYDLLTYKQFSNDVNSYINWTVENLEGTLFNKYGILSWTALPALQFSLMGNNADTEDAEYMNFASEVSVPIALRAINVFETPMNVLPFKNFKWIIEDTASSKIQLSSFLFYYCKSEGAMCPGVDGYPTVGEGQISPAMCEEGFTGYMYRECSNGQLGEPRNDRCRYKVPLNLIYPQSTYEFVVGTSRTTSVPTYDNIITEFSVDRPLPTGLTLNKETGEISGIPTVELAITERPFTITGSNPSGAVRVEIAIYVRKGQCRADGFFPTTVVGETAVYDCANQGNYIGTQKRACVLGATDGEWEKPSGACLAIFTIIILVVVVIIIVAVVILLLIRISRRRKAVGGVKTKKNMKKSGKNETKKTVTKKDVKV